MARTFDTPQWVFLCLVCAQYINVFANIITHPLRVTIASYFCQRLQQLLSLNVFHHYASRCSRRYMQPEPTHARRKPMQPIPVPKVSCHFLKNVLRAWPKPFLLIDHDHTFLLTTPRIKNLGSSLHRLSVGRSVLLCRFVVVFFLINARGKKTRWG